MTKLIVGFLFGCLYASSWWVAFVCKWVEVSYTGSEFQYNIVPVVLFNIVLIVIIISSAMNNWEK